MRRALFILLFTLTWDTVAGPLVFESTQGIEARWEDNNGPIDPLSETDSATGPGIAGVNLTSGKCYEPACAILSGFQAGDGSSYLGLEVAWADSVNTTSRARLEVRRRLTILNDGISSVWLDFDYTLKDMSIDLFAGSGGPSKDVNPLRGPSDSVGVQIGYQVFFNSVEARRHTFTIWGGFNPPEQNVSFDWESEGGLAPTMLSPSDCVFGQCGGRIASFGEFSRSLPLGRFGIGEEKEIETRMWIEAVGKLSQEWDAKARIGDPSGIPPTNLAVVQNVPRSVPIATPLYLVLLGLPLLWLRRSKSGYRSIGKI